MLAFNGTMMVFLPLVSLILLNWKIHKAIQNREQFRYVMTDASDKRPSAAAPVKATTKVYLTRVAVT